MTKIHPLLAAILLLICTIAATESAVAEEAALVLPPTMYYSNINDELFDIVKAKPMLAQVDKEIYGSPLSINITYTFAPTNGGVATGLTSAVLAGGTLGLLPIVSNSDLVVTYTLAAHGKELCRFSYTKNFTQATNIYSNKSINRLDKPMMDWVETTVDSFTQDLSKDQNIRTLTDEYNFYFTNNKAS